MYTVETLAALTQKHPPAALDRREACSSTSDPRFETLRVLDDVVSQAIRLFPAGSAGDPGGVTPQHVKDFISAGLNG